MIPEVCFRWRITNGDIKNHVIDLLKYMYICIPLFMLVILNIECR
jgi:hypothetical protein